jgi:nucleotide-binding universal stress UspA family protein
MLALRARWDDGCTDRRSVMGPLTGSRHDVEWSHTLFERVVVGVDGGDEALEAVRQAARLVTQTGGLEVLCAVDIGESAMAGFRASATAARLEQDAAEAVRKALEIAGPAATSRVVFGRPVATVLGEVRDAHATLVAVGTHGHSRLSEILIGGVTGELLHEAPCSVLVARTPPVAALFPRSVVVGTDGSPQADDAVAVAHALAERFDASLEVVTALGGKGVDHERARGGKVVGSSDHPVRALVEAAAGADLLVTGSRGLHGLDALGSVSERVAHLAPCSVLVVRGVG